MKRTSVLRMLALLALCMLVAMPGLAQKKKKGGGSTEPGTYKEWNKDIDTIEILETFSMSDYGTIVVTPFDSSSTPLPDKSDNTWEPVQTVLRNPQSAFADGLSGDAKGVTVSEGESGGAGALVISAKVVEMDPGSKAARYWAGFGAGAARARLEITVADGASGKVLLKIDQERRSGVGMAGGDYVELMQRNLRAIGKDMALVFSKF
jgi:hypothetical protein